MKTQKLDLKLPEILPHGWKQGVADALGIHRKTVTAALKRGESDPTYQRIMKCAKEKYGVPVEPLKS